MGGTIWETHDPVNKNKDNENAQQAVTTEKQVYIKPEGKPALILEPTDDISQLERVPAYIRRNKKLSGIITEN